MDEDTPIIMPDEKKVKVSVCTCSDQSNVKGIIQELGKMKEVVRDVTYTKLPYNVRDLNSFSFADIEVLLLCHSIENRRLSLTDVDDALYDGFLEKANRRLGRKRVGVIAHDIPESDLTHDQLEAFKRAQPSTFNESALTLMAGQLENAPIQLTPEQIRDIKSFLTDAADAYKCCSFCSVM